MPRLLKGSVLGLRSLRRLVSRLAAHADDGNSIDSTSGSETTGTATRTDAKASSLEALESRVLMSTYFVATNGSDSNAGAVTAPFRTIQRAANLAKPGDTVYVRGGTYRETVRPANNGTASARIAYKAYPGEKVTVSGADVVTGWS